MMGTDCFVTLDACLYVLLLLRNYHIGWYLFWQSSLSTHRPALFLKVANGKLSPKFALKYCMSSKVEGKDTESSYKRLGSQKIGEVHTESGKELEKQEVLS